MEIQFKTKNPKQIEAAEYWIDDTTEELLYGGAKGGGKSYIGCSLIFGDALIYPGTHYFIARKELNDLRKYTIPSVHEVFRNWGLDIEKYAPFNGQDNIFHLHNGSKVYLISCSIVPSDPLFERFGSMQMTRGWIEEAGEVAEAAKSNLWLSIGRWRNEEYKLKKKLLLTANPKKGYLKRDYVDPWKKGELPLKKKFVQALPTDNKYLSADYLETLKNEKDVVRRQRLWLGDWDYDEDKNSLINFESLIDAFTNTIDKTGEKYLVIDVARMGQDSTVFSFWDGLEMYRIERYQKQDTEKTKQMARDFATAEQIPYSNIMVDEDGIGGAVVDGMFGVKGFVANSTPLPTASQIRGRHASVEHDLIPKTNFRNLKSQCAFKLAELINEHKIAFQTQQYRDIIIEELSAILRHKDIDTDGKLQVKPKDEVKQDIGRSPDVGDTILMRAWFELRKEALDEDPGYSIVLATQHNAFARNKRNMDKNSSE
jgi:hypothetical protein